MADALLDVNRYPESESELKALLARKYGLKPENVLIGNGSNELIETALKALKTRGPDGGARGRPELRLLPHSRRYLRIRRRICAPRFPASRPSANRGHGEREDKGDIPVQPQ